MNEEMKLATAIKVGNEAIKTFIIDFPESVFRQLALRIYFEQASSFEEIAFVYRNTRKESDLRNLAEIALQNTPITDFFNNHRLKDYRLLELLLKRELPARENWTIFCHYHWWYSQNKTPNWLTERTYSDEIEFIDNEYYVGISQSQKELTEEQEIEFSSFLGNHEGIKNLDDLKKIIEEIKANVDIIKYLYNRVLSTRNSLSDIAHYSRCIEKTGSENPLTTEEKEEVRTHLLRNSIQKLKTLQDINELVEALDLYRTYKSDLLEYCQPIIEQTLCNIYQYEEVKVIKPSNLHAVLSEKSAKHLIEKASKVEDFSHLLEALSYSKSYLSGYKLPHFLDQELLTELQNLGVQKVVSFISKEKSLDKVLEYSKTLPRNCVEKRLDELALTTKDIKKVYKENGGYHLPKYKIKENPTTIDDYLQRCLDEEHNYNDCRKAIELAKTIEDLYYIFEYGRYSNRNEVLRMIFEKAKTIEDLLFVYENALGHGVNYNWQPDHKPSTLAEKPYELKRDL